MVEISNSTMVEVVNLLGYKVVYMIDEDNIRRVFGPYEKKQISAGELRKLYYQTGGASMLANSLSVRNKQLAAEFGVSDDSYSHEYMWTQKDVDNMLLNGSLDELLDALDFAPAGILDMIKDRAVALKLNNIEKRKAIQDITGYDINAQINIIEKIDAESGESKEEVHRERRVKNTTSELKETSRRVS